MSLTFTATLFEWRGPAPHFFLRVPDDQVPDLRSAVRLVTYGWGMIRTRIEWAAKPAGSERSE